MTTPTPPSPSNKSNKRNLPPEHSHPPPPRNLILREIEPRDIAAVCAIECDTAQPWSERKLLRHLMSTRCDCVGIVATLDGRVCGYAIFEPGKEYVDLVRIGVAATHRRKSIGRTLIGKILCLQVDMRCLPIVMATVRESDIALLSWLKNQGWETVDLCREYFDKPTEDGIVFKMDLREACANEIVEKRPKHRRGRDVQ